MAQTCIGLCERLKTVSVKNGLRYSSGQKRCSLCAHYFYIDGCRCPCCKTRLRSKPRSRHKNKNFENGWFHASCTASLYFTQYLNPVTWHFLRTRISYFLMYSSWNIEFYACKNEWPDGCESWSKKNRLLEMIWACIRTQ